LLYSFIDLPLVGGRGRPVLQQQGLGHPLVDPGGRG
jgi:hypothetical protein